MQTPFFHLLQAIWIWGPATSCSNTESSGFFGPLDVNEIAWLPAGDDYIDNDHIDLHPLLPAVDQSAIWQPGTSAGIRHLHKPLYHWSHLGHATASQLVMQTPFFHLLQAIWIWGPATSCSNTESSGFFGPLDVNEIAWLPAGDDYIDNDHIDLHPLLPAVDQSAIWQPGTSAGIRHLHKPLYHWSHLGHATASQLVMQTPFFHLLQQADVPAYSMEVVVEDEAAGVSPVTPEEDPPRGAAPAERVAAAPVLQHPVRPPRRQRPRRVDTLTTMSSQCARSLEQGDEVLQVLRRIEASTTRLAVAAERTTAAQEGILQEVRAIAQNIAEHLQQPRN
ncbi:uncharacterized protein [Dermacentor albipictus]|uniref:uncharacterized protein n=1 Tax=Dermacentor albipictus TaxID=60249 RepID=UPI0038FCEC57